MRHCRRVYKLFGERMDDVIDELSIVTKIEELFPELDKGVEGRSPPHEHRSHRLQSLELLHYPTR